MIKPCEHCQYWDTKGDHFSAARWPDGRVRGACKRSARVEGDWPMAAIGGIVPKALVNADYSGELVTTSDFSCSEWTPHPPTGWYEYVPKGGHHNHTEEDA